MKKIVSLILIGLILVSSLTAFADLTPVVISTYTTEVPEGHDLIRGYVISYENQTLSLEVEGKDYPVTIYDANNAFEKQLVDLNVKDHIELVAEKGEATYLLTEIRMINPIMDISPMPVLISAQIFEVTQEGDTFTITINENASTGYTWIYTISDAAHVTFVSEEVITSENAMPGAPNKRAFTFTVHAKGISTIKFDNKRAWEDEAVDSLDILVYKTDDKLFVEENQIATIDKEDHLDTIDLISYNPTKVFYNSTELVLDVNVQVIDGVTMIPVAETLRAMGYNVTWNHETKSVEIQKGAQWTSITIGNNAYFKNRMAPSELSAAPVIVNGRTMVPAEFFSAILDLGFEIEAGSFKLNDYSMGSYQGYVKSIDTDETGAQRITLEYELSSLTGDVIIHTSNAFTYFNTEVEIGSPIRVISSMVTTMSIPPQTSGYIIY